jgi:uroporphyrinogen decarboxylase
VNHKERVLSALTYSSYDRMPVTYQGEPVVTHRLMKHFGLSDHSMLLECLGDDLRYVQPEWVGPMPQSWPDGSYEIGWPDRSWSVGTRYKNVPVQDGWYSEVCYRPFEGIADPGELADVEFPTADWFDYSTIREQCVRCSEFAIVTGRGGILDFVNGISLTRGMEQVLIDIAKEEPVFLALMDSKYRFHYETFERTLKAGDGLIDIVLCGEDLAGQGGLLISPRSFDRLFAPKFESFFAMVHQHRAKVMLHSCGSIRRLIPRLIDLGLDILNVVQTSAAGMDIRELRNEFGGRIAFCGSMCVQTTLPNGDPEQVRREVELRKGLFADGGMILGPTHAIQPDTPLENILVMYDAAGSLRTRVGHR